MTVREIDVRQLERLLGSGADVVLVDVREPWEHALGVLPGSVTIPLGELAERADEIAPGEGALVVTICHHGVRSLSAAAILRAAGLRDVVSLAGGTDAWSRVVDPTLRRY